jgi:hypothetical protein
VVLVKNAVPFTKATPTVRGNTNAGFSAGPAGAAQNSGLPFTQTTKHCAEDSIRGWRGRPEGHNPHNIDERADHREPLFSRVGNKYQAIEVDSHALCSCEAGIWHADECTPCSRRCCRGEESPQQRGRGINVINHAPAKTPVGEQTV